MLRFTLTCWILGIAGLVLIATRVASEGPVLWCAISYVTAGAAGLVYAGTLKPGQR